MNGVLNCKSDPTMNKNGGKKNDIRTLKWENYRRGIISHQASSTLVESPPKSPRTRVPECSRGHETVRLERTAQRETHTQTDTHKVIIITDCLQARLSFQQSDYTDGMHRSTAAVAARLQVVVVADVSSPVSTVSIAPDIVHE